MQYPLDPTGISPANKITGETKVVSPPNNIRDASFFVPRVTPFFRQGLVITLGTRILIEGVDYILVFRSMALSEHFERELFGGVMFINFQFTGTVKLTYQVLGGEFSTDDATVLEDLSRSMGAVRWVTYDALVGLPSSFPPAYHTHDIETDLVDMGDVVDAVEALAGAVSSMPQSVGEVSTRLTAHLNSTTAHTPNEIGLSKVENLPVAALADLTSGARKYVTADQLAAYLPGVVSGAIPDFDTSGLSAQITQVRTDFQAADKVIRDNLASTTGLVNGHTTQLSTINTNISNLDKVYKLADALIIGKLPVGESASLATLLQRIKTLEGIINNTKSSELPIGAIFESVINYADGNAVSTALGYGKWERFGVGSVTVGQATSINPYPTWTRTVGNTYGDFVHTLTVNEMPEHKHGTNLRVEAGYATLIDKSLYYTASSGNMLDHLNESGGGTTYTTNQGKGTAHNNTQPSVVVSRWVRKPDNYVPIVMSFFYTSDSAGTKKITSLKESDGVAYFWVDVISLPSSTTWTFFADSAKISTSGNLPGSVKVTGTAPTINNTTIGKKLLVKLNVTAGTGGVSTKPTTMGLTRNGADETKFGATIATVY